MPVMDGGDFAREFHRIHDRRAPIVVLSATTDARSHARTIGADACLNKPFGLKELLAVVSEHVRA